MSDWEMVGRLGLAAGLGFVLGLERSIRKPQRGAGERTFALVALGACLFTLAGAEVAGEQSPTRIAAQVVTGIGFLGAGLIVRREVGISGLTTAASVWLAAAIGVAVGLGFLAIATAATFFGVVVLLMEYVLPQALRDRATDIEEPE